MAHCGNAAQSQCFVEQVINIHNSLYRWVFNDFLWTFIFPGHLLRKSIQATQMWAQQPTCCMYGRRRFYCVPWNRRNPAPWMRSHLEPFLLYYSERGYYAYCEVQCSLQDAAMWTQTSSSLRGRGGWISSLLDYGNVEDCLYLLLILTNCICIYFRPTELCLVYIKLSLVALKHPPPAKKYAKSIAYAPWIADISFHLRATTSLSPMHGNGNILPPFFYSNSCLNLIFF